MYAQTNIQLFNQLQRQGYVDAEMALVYEAYELAKQLFAGCFINSGRTQIAHVVGTASILGSLRAAAEVVAAGLVHNVYENGDFGDGRRSISTPRRRQIRQAVGATVEEYVYRFPTIKHVVVSLSQPLRPQALSIGCGNPGTLDPIDRGTVLIVLADQLDHRRNLEYVQPNDYRTAEIAEQIDFVSLAVELRTAVKHATSSKFRLEFAQRLNRPKLIAPRSCYRRPAVALRQELSRVSNTLSRLFHSSLSFHRNSELRTRINEETQSTTSH